VQRALAQDLRLRNPDKEEYDEAPARLRGDLALVAALVGGLDAADGEREAALVLEEEGAEAAVAREGVGAHREDVHVAVPDPRNPLGPQVPDPALEEGRLPHGDGDVPGEGGGAARVAGEEEVLLGEVGLHPELRPHGQPDDGRRRDRVGHRGRVGRRAAGGQHGEEHCIVGEGIDVMGDGYLIRKSAESIVGCRRHWAEIGYTLHCTLMP